MTSESTQLPAELVRDNLYNWLGYGNLNGRYWFVGREEYDSIDRCRYLDDLRDYYEVRRGFDYAEDFVDVWEHAYGRSVEEATPTTSTRHYQAAFLLALAGESPRGTHPQTGRSRTSSYVFAEKRFGHRDGNHFSGEVYPLRYHPDHPQTFDPYRGVWDTPESYKEEVHPSRIDLYVQQLEANPNVEVVVNYARSAEFVTPLHERLEYDPLGTRPANARNEFELSLCYLRDDRSVLLVDSPFFGQGHVGYSEIENLVDEFEELLQNE